MSWILYSIMTPDGDVVRRSGRFENMDILDEEASRRGEMIVNFFELPDAVYSVRQWIMGRMGDLEIAEFCSMLSMYVSGGVDLQSALSDMENSARSPALKHVVSELRRALMNGYPLSQALKTTGQFPEEVLALARIGEESGTLDSVLRDAGLHIERVVAIKSAAKRAMIYPAFTLSVILGGALFWLSFVVPKVAEVFKSINLKLPPSTMALVAASNWVRDYWWIIVFVLFALPVGFFMLRRNEKFRYQTDRLAWHLPVFGRIIKGSQTAFYFQYLSLMYGAGVVITVALETLTHAVQNRYLRSRVAGIVEQLRAGEPLVRAVEHAGIFEPLAVRMVGIGEETGNLEGQVKKLGEIYFARVNGLVEVLSKILEPMLLIVMAGLFGFFVVAVIGPIYGSIGSLGK